MSTTADITIRRHPSSFCRDDRHGACSSVGARCDCECHGRAPGDFGFVAERPAVAAVSSPPAPERIPVSPAAAKEKQRVKGEHRCLDCGRTFEKPQGLGRHRTTMHNDLKRAAAKLAAKPARDRTPPAVPEAAVVLDVDRFVAHAGEWLDIGVLELRAVTVDERLVVQARFVEEGT